MLNIFGVRQSQYFSLDQIDVNDDHRHTPPPKKNKKNKTKQNKTTTNKQTNKQDKRETYKGLHTHLRLNEYRSIFSETNPRE